MPDQLRAYVELQRHIRKSLRAEHPEWIEPNGDSPICESYESRFAELLQILTPGTPAMPRDRQPPRRSRFGSQTPQSLPGR